MGTNDRLGLSLPLDCFTNDQRWHLVAHRMCNLPTMTVFAECFEHRNVRLCTKSLLCGNSPETGCRMWECPVQSHEWRPAQ